MSRYTSEQNAYSSLKKKYVPLWRLDTNTMTVTHFNTDTQTEESKTYHADFIRYHLHFSDSHCPNRLRRLVNEGRIVQYLDDIERKVSEAISRQVKLWKQIDSCYQDQAFKACAEDQPLHHGYPQRTERRAGRGSTPPGRQVGGE